MAEWVRVRSVYIVHIRTGLLVGCRPGLPSVQIGALGKSMTFSFFIFEIKYHFACQDYFK